MLNEIFGLDLSDWEAKLASTGYLSRTRIRKEMFEAHRHQKLVAALDSLNKLPSKWAREICLQILIEK